MTHEAKAKELVDYFKRLVYPYIGSSMLTNTEDEEVILMNSKTCALKCVDESLIALKFTNDSKWYVEQAKEYQQVKQAIEKM